MRLSRKVVRTSAMVIVMAALSGCLLQPTTRVEAPPPSSSRSSTATPVKPISRPTQPPGTYAVRSGDTLYSIAFRHGLDYRELARWNQLLDPSRIFVGQSLRLTAPSVSPTRAPTPIPSPTSVSPKPTATPPVVTRPAVPATSSSPPAPPPSTVSSAIGVPTQPAAPVTPAGSGPTTTPVAESPELSTPQPLGSSLPTTTRPSPPVETPKPIAAPIVVPPPPLPAQPPVPSVVTKPQANAPPPVEPSAVGPAPSTAALPTVNPNAPSKLVSGIKWRWPTEGKVVGRFVPGDPTESGIDIGGRLGQIVVAAADGEVVYSGNGLLGYGELVIIQHTPEFLSAYGHNQKRLVGEGTKVKAGQAIAEMGRQAGLDLLHFEIRKGGKPIDPIGFLP